MKLLLVGNYRPDRQKSMQRFAELLLREVRAQGHEVRLLRPAVVFNLPLPVLRRVSKWLGYLDKFVVFPLTLRLIARWPDVIHIADHSNSAYIFALPPKPQVINCHDLLAIRCALGEIPDVSTRGSGKILQSIILKGLKRARRIVCISNNTREELLRLSQIDPEIASVIYMGANFSYQPLPAVQSWDWVGGIVGPNGGAFEALQRHGFLLHVGGDQWYKNRLGVLRIYQQLRILKEAANEDGAMPKLVMVGQPLDESMREFLNQHHLQDEVIEVQGCSNEALQAFYSMAEVMLFPSLAEGFGWPVVEAQSCGCRVLTSNFAPLTEIGGEAAIYCDPRDEKEAARQLQQLLNETSSARLNRVESGIRNAQRFSAQKMAEEYIAVYREVLQTTQSH